MKRNRTIIGFAAMFTLLTCAAGLMAQSNRGAPPQHSPAARSQERGQQRGRARDEREDQDALRREARITLEQARTIALQREAGTILSEELEREHGRLVYSFDIRNGRGTITDIEVNALNGAIVSVEEETAEQEREETNEREDADENEDDEDQATLRREARITVEQARAIALNRETGTIESEELERENGTLVYSFDIRNARGTITEIEVSAIDGRIVSAER